MSLWLLWLKVYAIADWSVSLVSVAVLLFRSTVKLYLLKMQVKWPYNHVKMGTLIFVAALGELLCVQLSQGASVRWCSFNLIYFVMFDCYLIEDSSFLHRDRKGMDPEGTRDRKQMWGIEGRETIPGYIVYKKKTSYFQQREKKKQGFIKLSALHLLKNIHSAWRWCAKSQRIKVITSLTTEPYQLQQQLDRQDIPTGEVVAQISSE